MGLQTLRSGGTSHPEEIVAFQMSRFIDASGVFDKAGGALLVTQQSSPDMTVKIALGYAFITKSDKSMCYPVRLHTAVGSGTITANGSGNGRIDAVALYIDLAASPDATVTNVAKLMVVAGTPAGSPVAPSDAAIQTAVGASNPFIRLANVAVASGASSITNANITDTRTSVIVSDGFDFKEAIKHVLLDSTSANEYDYSGVLQDLTAGETLAAFEVGYMKSDGKVWKADADSDTTAPVMCMALAAITANASGRFILLGNVKNASWSWTVGGKIFLSNTAGALTQTAPSGTDDVVQVVGVAVASNRMMFNPSPSFFLHT